MKDIPLLDEKTSQQRGGPESNLQSKCPETTEAERAVIL